MMAAFITRVRLGPRSLPAVEARANYTQNLRGNPELVCHRTVPGISLMYPCSHQVAGTEAFIRFVLVHTVACRSPVVFTRSPLSAARRLLHPPWRGSWPLLTRNM